MTVTKLFTSVFLTFACCSVSFNMLPRVSNASTVAMSFSGGELNNFATAPVIAGHGFEVTQDIIVTDLGMYDFANDGLSTEQAVGLYSSSGDEIVQATIRASTDSPLVDGFRYEAIPQTRLFAGEVYRLLGHRPSNSDPHVFGGTVTTAPEIQLIGGFGDENIANLRFINRETTSQTNFGPNFRFYLVPEPRSLILAALGITVFLCRKRPPWLEEE